MLHRHLDKKTAWKQFDFVKVGRKTQRCDQDFLSSILINRPPRLEVVNEFEVYKVDEIGKRIRRICGRPHLYKLPRFVPDGIANPHHVINPYEEYVCLNGAGWGRGTSWGPCRFHNSFGSLSKRLATKAYEYDQIRKDNIAVVAGDYKAHLRKVQNEISPDELFEITRPLYEFEALKSMLIEAMEATGQVDQESVKQIADIVSKAANTKLVTAKFEQKMLKNKQIERLVEALIYGMISCIESVVDKQQLTTILDLFRNNVLIPVGTDGFSELFLRQRESGLHEKYEVLGPGSDMPKVSAINGQ